MKWNRERGAGSGKDLEPGFELGTPVVQQHCMSMHLPTRLSAPTATSVLVLYSTVRVSELQLLRL